MLGLAFSVVTFPYVCRVMGAENIGVINFVYAYGYHFMHFASFGINSYAIRELSRVRDDNFERNKVSNEIFNINIISSVCSFLIYFLGVVICRQLNNNFWLFFMYSFTILTNFLALDWMLQSFDDYWFATIRSIIIRILSICAVFLFVKSNSDIYLYMAISCISELGS